MFVFIGIYVELRFRYIIYIDILYKSKVKVIFLKYLFFVYFSIYLKIIVWILEFLRKIVGVNIICLCEKKEIKYIFRGY